MIFTKDALEFLFQNRVMNSRTWFEEHRYKYLKLVKEPMYSLIDELSPGLTEIDPLIVTRPSRCVSRIRRDTRFTHDKTLYRDVVWGIFMRDRKLFNYPPAFFFEFCPTGFRYGCGYYQLDTAAMNSIRALILEGNSSFKKAKRSMEKQSLFEVTGEMYKRTRHKDQPEELRYWLDRKNIGAIRTLDSPDLLVSDTLTETLMEGFNVLKPMYKFLCDASDRRMRTV